MFNQQTPIDYSYDEGVVTEVDASRKVCRVKTLRGQNVDCVYWLGSTGRSSRHGNRSTPVLGNRVMVFSGLGYPVIMGVLPKLQSTDNTFPLSIDEGSMIVDTGNFTSEGVSIIGDQDAPLDSLVGDQVMTSTGGGMIAALRGGSVLLRSSRLSEIFLSRWNDLVRVVSRNWQHFSDLHSDVIYNFNNRLFRYVGIAKNFSNAKIEEYTWHQYSGDTVAAEKIKADYQNQTVEDAFNGVMYKEQLKDGDLPETMHRTVHLDGTDETIVVHTRHTQKIDSHVFTWSEQNTITIDPGKIRIDFNGASWAEFTADGIKIEHGSHFVRIDDSGTHLG